MRANSMSLLSPFARQSAMCPVAYGPAAKWPAVGQIKLAIRHLSNMMASLRKWKTCSSEIHLSPNARQLNDPALYGVDKREVRDKREQFLIDGAAADERGFKPVNLIRRAVRTS